MNQSPWKPFPKYKPKAGTAIVGVDFDKNLYCYRVGIDNLEDDGGWPIVAWITIPSLPEDLIFEANEKLEAKLEKEWPIKTA